MFNDAIRVLAEREWILTNNLGGYALGFGDMINKRKYNGLLISSFDQMKRVHILSSLEEKVESNGAVFDLDSSHYKECIHPTGYKKISRVWLRPYPCALYSTVPPVDNYMILKEMFMIQGKNATVIKYTNRGKFPVFFTLRPKFSMRDHHKVNHVGTWDYTPTRTEIKKNQFKFKRDDSGVEVFGYSNCDVIEEKLVYRDVYYPIEALRGYDPIEDLIAPVRMSLNLNPNESSYLVFSSEKLDDPINMAKEAENYYKKLPLPKDHPNSTEDLLSLTQNRSLKVVFDKSDYEKILSFAAKDFLTSNDIIAGFPWFGPWGRDTLICLQSLKYLPNGKNLALKILEKYGSRISNGLLPNTFGEGGEGLNYDTVDAPLWFVLGCYEYASKNEEFFKKVCEIILYYIFDDSHPFFVADDGLVELRQCNQALTWMDAKVYEEPVTPRFGKPIEINALWYNSLKIAKEMALNIGKTELSAGSYNLKISALDDLIKKVESGLQNFVGTEFLADRIENEKPIWEIRPNAVIALSLPFDFLGEEILQNVWKRAKEDLLTPYGLRTLNPSNPAFKQKYIGNQKQRDFAYHQGTAWSFLLLPFVKLTKKVMKNESLENVKREIGGYIWTLRDSMMKDEMASIAEVWDGVNANVPKGCPAQAWSVFALLEIEAMLREMDINL